MCDAYETSTGEDASKLRPNGSTPTTPPALPSPENSIDDPGKTPEPADEAKSNDGDHYL